MALVPKPFLMLVILLASVGSRFSFAFVLPPPALKPVRLPLSEKGSSKSARDAKDSDSDCGPQPCAHIGMLATCQRPVCTMATVRQLVQKTGSGPRSGNPMLAMYEQGAGLGIQSCTHTRLCRYGITLSGERQPVG